MSMHKLASNEAADAGEAYLQDMNERMAKFKGENAPKGLPSMPGNTDVTDATYPTAHNQPKEQYWAGTKLVAGSGGGPIL